MEIKEVDILFKKELKNNYDTNEIRTFFFTLLEHICQKDKVFFYTEKEYFLNENQQKSFLLALEALKKNKPIQYITNKAIFCENSFFVDENVLIPRPETEELVYWVINSVKNNDKNLKILDICTGSGCIAVSLAKFLPKSTIFALDISEKALEVAKNNAKNENVPVLFFQKNCLEEMFFNEEFDIIISNPPYVRESEKLIMKKNVLEYEPHLALFVEDKNPLIFYQKIAEFSKKNLKKDGDIFFEINEFLYNETINMLNSFHFSKMELKKDIFEKNRMLKITK